MLLMLFKDSTDAGAADAHDAADGALFATVAVADAIVLILMLMSFQV